MTEERMDWDSEISKDGEDMVLLPAETIVEFAVVEFEKSRSKAGDPMAKLILSLDNGDDDTGFGRAREQLVLKASCEWKLCQFFTAIGQRQHGEVLKPKWNEVKGATGYGIVGIDTFKSDKGDTIKKNIIAKFLEPGDGKKQFEDQQAAEPKAEHENLNLG